MNAGDNYERIVVIKFGYMREHLAKLKVLVFTAVRTCCFATEPCCKNSKNLLDTDNPQGSSIKDP